MIQGVSGSLSTDGDATVVVERTLSPALAEASRACLDEHREALEALLTKIEEPDAKVVHRVATGRGADRRSEIALLIAAIQTV